MSDIDDEIEIRELTESDYNELILLYVELDFLHVQERPDCFIHRDADEIYPKDAFIHNIAYPGCTELGAFYKGKLVGFVSATLWEESLMVKNVKTVCLDNIYVFPEYRCKGIGTKLFKKIEDWAKKNGAVRLDLHTWDFNKTAIAMYEKMGMVPQRYVFEKKL